MLRAFKILAVLASCLLDHIAVAQEPSLAPRRRREAGLGHSTGVISRNDPPLGAGLV
jgi:hypothetical protein